MDATSSPSGLLLEARRLAASRDWAALVELLGSSAAGEDAEVPELAFLHADAVWRLGEPARGAPIAGEALAGARRRGDRHLTLRALNTLGICLFYSGETDRAEDEWTQLLEEATSAQDPLFVARAANNLGMLENMRGRREKALTNYQHAIAGYTREGNGRGLAQTHYNVGLTFRDLGFDRDADAHFRRAIGFAEASDTEELVGMAETERAALLARAGDGRMAETLATRALDRFRQLNEPVAAGEALRVLGLAARARGDDATAGERLDAALETASRYEDLQLRADVQRDRGFFLRDQDRPGDAAAALLESADCFERLGSKAEAEALRLIASELRQEA